MTTKQESEGPGRSPRQDSHPQAEAGGEGPTIRSAPNAVPMANTLARSAALASARRFTGEPLPGFERSAR
jgi:hypothetical protein